MKPRIFFAIIFIQILVTVIIFFQIRNRSFSTFNISGNKYENERIQESLATNNSSYALHPYLGFVLDYGIDPNSNKFGFNGQDITFKNNSNDYIVGIFGGSVAQIYYAEEKDNFIKELNSRLKNKNIKVYSFALGGYKQPQQLMTLQYLLALGYKFDLIINIDGFNEAALPFSENYQDNVSTYFPRGWILYSTQYFDKSTISLINTINYLKSIKNFFTKLPSNLVYFPNIIVNSLYNKSELNLDKRLNQIMKTYQTKGPEPYMDKSENGIEQDIVNVWYNSSLQMARIAKSNNIQYLEFLQPNQYLPNSKHFSQEELNKYVNINHPYAYASKEIYPKIIERLPELKENGVSIYDLTNIFINEYGSIYNDNCCHYNERGFSLMTKNIIPTIKVNY